MPFDASRYPNAVTIGRLIAERMGMGRPLPEMRAARGHGSGDAAPGSACPVFGRAVQMHALRLEADRGATGHRIYAF